MDPLETDVDVTTGMTEVTFSDVGTMVDKGTVTSESTLHWGESTDVDVETDRPINSFPVTELTTN